MMKRKRESPGLKQTSILAFLSPESSKRTKCLDESPGLISPSPKKNQGKILSSRVRRRLTCGSNDIKKDSPEKLDEKRKSLKSVENLMSSPKEPGSAEESAGGCLTEELAKEFDSAFFEGDSEQSEPVFRGDHAEIADIEDLNFGSWNLGNFDLTNGERCVVTDVGSQGLETRLSIKLEKNGLNGRLLLRDMWSYLEVQVGYRIGVKAIQVQNDWLVDAANGWVSVEPDFFISSTQLTGSMFCRRKGVISQFFKGIELDNKVMGLGSIIHELFQWAVTDPEAVSESSLREKLLAILDSPGMLRMLYSCDSSVDKVLAEVSSFIPRIIEFVENFMLSGGQARTLSGGFEGKISKIVKVEDDVANRIVGLKGRIDVTVEISETGKVPLELKTGRPTFSSEHRTQLVVYTLIMSSEGTPTSSGLLVYLRDGVVSLVTPTHAELRDVVLLRNQMVSFVRAWNPSILPEPIRFASACEKCPYLQVCTALLPDDSTENQHLRRLSPVLPAPHLEYFNKWVRTLALEEQESETKTKISGLELLAENQTPSHFTYTLKKNKTGAEIQPGSLVYVTCETSGESFAGKITANHEETCEVVIGQQLRQCGNFFTIERLKSSLIARHLSSLGILLNPQYSNLREIFCGETESEFDRDVNFDEKNLLVAAALTSLNQEQRNAVVCAVQTKNYMLLEGPPGTGKTQTIVAMIRVFLAMGKTVLVAAHSHSSVDNILLKLRETTENFLRLGQLSSINEKLHTYSYIERVKFSKTVGDITDVLSSPILATTCLGLDSDLIIKKQYNVCIVDEATQALQSEVLRPLLCSEKFILVGDPKQLGPVVKFCDVTNVSPFDSLLQRNSKKVQHLTRQYRMNKIIMNVANSTMYDGRLKCGTETVAQQTLQVEKISPVPWCQKILSGCLEDSIVFLDTSNGEVIPTKDNCSNTREVEFVVKIIDQLLSCGVDAGEIGVMAPYRSQIQLLVRALPGDVEVNTVDQYQGRDKACIIISCTREGGERSNRELLSDPRRLNVAITRARKKLIIVGHLPTLKQYEPFQKILHILTPNAFISV